MALRAATATIPEAIIVGISSPYSRKGELWRMYEKHLGRDDTDRVLVVNAPTRTLNPTVDQAFIDQAYEDDPIAAAAEFGGEWRRDVDGVSAARRVTSGPGAPIATRSHSTRASAIPRLRSGRWHGRRFVHPRHRTRGAQGRAVLDLFREIRPPFSPEGAVTECVTALRNYRLERQGRPLRRCLVAEAFRKRGVQYDPSERTKSELYLEALPLFTTGRVEIFDHRD